MNDIPATMTQNELASFLRLSSGQIRTKATDGILVRSGRGRYDVRASLGNYLDRLREHAARAGRPAAGNDDLKAEKLKLTAAQREAQEMKNAATRGNLVSADDVARGWASILTDVRAGMLAVPSRMADLTQHQRAQLDAELRLALERLARGEALQ